MCLSIAINRPEDVLSKGEHLGFEWMVVHNCSGYRCGYVRVPLGHSWHGKGYDDLNLNVHGGITFAEADVPCKAPGPDTDWWVGFDCAHAFDAPDPGLPSRDLPIWHEAEAVVRSQDYVEAECRSLCQQAAEACLAAS